MKKRKKNMVSFKYNIKLARIPPKKDWGTWLSSMFTSFFKEFWMAIVLMVASLSLATFILTLRGFFDYQVGLLMVKG